MELQLKDSQMKTYMVDEKNGVFNGIYAVFISVWRLTFTLLNCFQ